MTRLLVGWRDGDAGCFSELVGILYAYLREQARSQLRRLRPGETLGTTALVHEAYLKLEHYPGALDSRHHFFAVAASAMRHILVDHARSKVSLKRGGGQIPRRLEDSTLPHHAHTLTVEGQAISLLDLNRALDRLNEVSPRLAHGVEYRFFGGLTEAQIATVLGVTDRTVRRDWIKARAWLHRELADGHPQDGHPQDGHSQDRRIQGTDDDHSVRSPDSNPLTKRSDSA